MGAAPACLRGQWTRVRVVETVPDQIQHNHYPLRLRLNQCSGLLKNTLAAWFGKDGKLLV